MEVVWIVGLIALWSVVLINLLLTLRIVSWLRAIKDSNERAAESENIPELQTEVPAPHFKTKTLSGSPVQLSDYAGHALALVFVSPHCGTCRNEMPMLVDTGARAKKRTGTEVILVSDRSTAETYAWISDIREEDNVDVDLPILVAPRGSQFRSTYNPRGLTPYFCYIDEQQVVRARGPLGAAEWPRLKQKWEGLSAVKPLPKSTRKYR